MEGSPAHPPPFGTVGGTSNLFPERVFLFLFSLAFVPLPGFIDRLNEARNNVQLSWFAEGVSAFFKGWTANFGRLGPHFVMSMPLLEFARRSLGVDTI